MQKIPRKQWGLHLLSHVEILRRIKITEINHRPNALKILKLPLKIRLGEVTYKTRELIANIESFMVLNNQQKICRYPIERLRVQVYMSLVRKHRTVKELKNVEYMSNGSRNITATAGITSFGTIYKMIWQIRNQKYLSDFGIIKNF